MESFIEFNINDYVYVRLTDFGRACLQRNHDELVALAGGHDPFLFKLPKEDNDGWSKWQMWHLMGELGQYTGMGSRNPFEMTIRIPTKGD